MTKVELISAVANKTELEMDIAEKTVNATIKSIIEVLSNGESISIPGLGVFSIRERKARKGKNPLTGKEITISARKIIVFTPAKSLKESLNKK